MTSDVPRYSAQVYNAVLRRNRISFTIGQIILFLMLQFEAVRSVTGFGEAPCNVFIMIFQMEDDEVEGCADYFRIKTFRSCGDADVQECVIVFGNAVLENGMDGVQLLQETDESFTGGACRRDAQMDAEQGIHAVVRDDGSYKAVAARRNGGDESHGILFVMGISALEEIQIIVFHIFFEDAGFYVFAGIEVDYFCHSASHMECFIHYTMGVHKKEKSIFYFFVGNKFFPSHGIITKATMVRRFLYYYVINEMYGYN